jgi:acyl-CoA synthetase (AMP-forming)/AMP-acid ligase II
LCQRGERLAEHHRVWRGEAWPGEAAVGGDAERAEAGGAVAGEAFTAELLAWATERLAKYKLPRSVDFIEAMPRDPNGKLYKRTLRDPHWVGKNRGGAN